MLLIVESDNGRTVDIRLGESVRVTLSENATTGYRWAIDRYDEQLFEMVTTEPNYPKNVIGSGGEVSFVFRAKNPGSGKVVLKHWRREGDTSVTNRFRVRLLVEPWSPSGKFGFMARHLQQVA